MAGFFDIMKEPPVQLNKDGSSGEEHSATHYFGRYPLFTRISIETLSFCNRTCSFCPLHWSQDERGRKRMTDQLYERIVVQLMDLQFDGVAQMFLLSEPTVDVTMLDKLRLLRDACPRVTTYASSNGDLFDKIAQSRGLDDALERVAAFYDAGLTVLNLNVYDPGPEQHARYRQLLEGIVTKLGAKITGNKYRTHNPRGRFVCLTDMRIDMNDTQTVTNVLYIKSKAERAAVTAPERHCARPHRHLVIEWDGRVPICCAIDVTDRSLPAMGDANTQSLLQIWNSPAMNQYRWFLQHRQRTLPGCSTCTHKMAFPHVVRKVQPTPEQIESWSSSTCEASVNKS